MHLTHLFCGQLTLIDQLWRLCTHHTVLLLANFEVHTGKYSGRSFEVRTKRDIDQDIVEILCG